MNEKGVTSRVILDAAYRNVTLLRNNSGAFQDQTGRLVRYGLGSYTERDELASSDYIGYTPVFVTPEMIGRFLAVFTAIEMKPEDWKFNAGDKRLLHQKNFIDNVLRAGGYAGFATSVEDFRKIVKHD